VAAFGYIVIGAESGHLHATASMDAATFDPMTEGFVGGAEGPQ
jgi:hypothetical protein